jgi:hypothetical protein
MGTNRSDLVSLVFDQHIKNFNHAYVSWMVYTRSLIFHISFCCEKSFQWYQQVWPCDLDIYFLTYLLKTFNFSWIFWMVCTRTLIFHMIVSWDKTFPWVLTDMTVTLALVFDLHIENFTLAITFEYYVLGLKYFIWLFLVTWPFHGLSLFVMLLL